MIVDANSKFNLEKPMELIFDKGDLGSPKGHALLYFRSRDDPDAVWVTYIVILPITVDVSKYVPPFLMNQVNEMGPKDLSAFAFPPAPERLGSYAEMETIAAQRDDDVLFAGTTDAKDVSTSMMEINDAVQQYAEACSTVPGVIGQGDIEEEVDDDGLGVNEALYGLMSDSAKLSELTKLIGRLRYAVEGGEENLISETEEEIGLLSGYLPPNHDVPLLIAAVKSNETLSDTLADLYLQRCFHLVHEEYTQVRDTEDRIKRLDLGG